ncbi:MULTISPECIES: FHA domain-containing protein [unclassified Streptomyces]|uniref:FHA domain-containing protein n=1 Tax=unclassified Streptomyces TaxID=2593676 RepID=UPI0033EBD246
MPASGDGPRETVRIGGPGHTLVVVFPWGRYPIGSAPLVVGRSVTEAGELAERMLEYGRWAGNDYGNVSRAHAILWSDAEGTWIRHVSGTNASRVNGAPLLPDRPHRLRPGDVLAFAAQLRAHVEEAGAE